MLIQFSVILAFSTLFVASVFDVKSSKGDVPEIILYIGLVGGVVLHGLHSLITSNTTPIVWSLVAGLATLGYGYFAYRKGMWGGADMFGIAILGFSTSYFFGVMGTLDLLINMMGAGFFYALGFGLIGGLRSKSVRDDFIKRVQHKNWQILLFLILGAIISTLANVRGLNGMRFFLFYSGMVIVYYFMESVEQKLMVREVKASEVEEGDVLAEGEIKGVTQDDLDQLEDKVKLKKGIRFMPVFPAAIAMTAAGISLLTYLTGII
jgi:hypothetical protein